MNIETFKTWFNDYVISYGTNVYNNFDTYEFVLLGANLFILLISKFLFKFLYRDNKEKAKPRFKIAIFLSFVLFVLQIIYLIIGNDPILIEKLGTDNDFETIIGKLSLTFLVMYVALLLQSVTHFIIKKNYGSKEQIDNKDVFVETSGSRIWTVLSVSFINFGFFYFLIKLWSAEYLMNSTSILGLIAVALALTNAVWFPDIYSGIISLKVKIANIGDTIMVEGIDKKNELIVKDTGFFKLTTYDIRTNHIVFVWNNMIGKSVIHNLTRIASTSGLRIVVPFKISYPEMSNIIRLNLSDKEKDILADKYNGNINHFNIDDYIKSFRTMTSEAFDNVKDNKDIKLKDKAFKAIVHDTSDFAIVMHVSFYLGKLPRTTNTETIRSYLINTKATVIEEFLSLSYKYNIPLKTEDLVVLEKK